MLEIGERRPDYPIHLVSIAFIAGGHWPVLQRFLGDFGAGICVEAGKHGFG